MSHYNNEIYVNTSAGPAPVDVQFTGRTVQGSLGIKSMSTAHTRVHEIMRSKTQEGDSRQTEIYIYCFFCCATCCIDSLAYQ